MVLPMTLLFTPEELVQYLYNESSPEKSAAIDAALREDWTLREKLEVLQSSVETLNKGMQSPRTEVILRILSYARDTVTETVQH